MVYVKHGAKLLDKVFPDWFQRIDLTKFDITSHNDCIIGQLFIGNATEDEYYEFFSMGMRALGFYEKGWSEELADHGFAFRGKVNDEKATVLETAWKSAIKERLANHEKENPALL